MSSIPLSRRVIEESGWQPTLVVTPGPTAPPRPTRTVSARIRPAVRSWRSALVVGALLVALMVAVVAVGATSLARSLEGRVLPGTRLAGTDLSGLPLPVAAARVTTIVDEVLDRAVVVDVAGAQASLTARQLGVTSNRDAILRLLAADRARMSPWGWVRLRWLGGAPPPPPSLHLGLPDPRTVEVAVTDLSNRTMRRPVDAMWVHDDDKVSARPHVDGLRVDIVATTAAVHEALATVLSTPRAVMPARTPVVPAAVAVTPATVSTAQLGQVLVLDRTLATLTLHDDGQVTARWDLQRTGDPDATPVIGCGGSSDIEVLPPHALSGTRTVPLTAPVAECLRLTGEAAVALRDLVRSDVPLVTIG